MLRLKNIHFFVLSFWFVVLLVSCNNSSSTINKQLLIVANEINKNCPMMVDRATRLDNTLPLPEDIFQYNYTLVNLVKDSIDMNYFVNYMRPLILNTVKTNPDLKYFRDNKISMAYNYKDKAGVFLTKIVIKPEDYINQ